MEKLWFPGDGCLRIINGCLGSDDESEQVLQRIAQALRAYQEQDYVFL